MLCLLNMRALASLARAASQVKAFEAEAPALAAAATCPLRLANLASTRVVALLGTVLSPELVEPDSVHGSIALREARLVYNDTGATIAMLASIMRRIVCGATCLLRGIFHLTSARRANCSVWSLIC